MTQSKTITSFNFKSGERVADKYYITNKIGSGWEGEVYIVKELSTKIERGAKFFFPHRNLQMKTSKAAARKLHKLRDCQVLIPFHSHEIISFQEQKVVMLVSDFVTGESLSEFLSKQPGKRLSVYQGLHLLHSLALGIAEIQNHQEYHGDLHTDNIIIKRYGLGFDLKFIDFFNWSHPRHQNMKDDLFDLIKIFYDAIGGSKHYSKHPEEVKAICNGLRKNLIHKRFKSADALIKYIENINWAC